MDDSVSTESIQRIKKAMSLLQVHYADNVRLLASQMLSKQPVTEEEKLTSACIGLVDLFLQLRNGGYRFIVVQDKI